MGPKGAPISPDGAIAELAARQYGVVNLAQMLAAGLTRRQVKRRLQQGRLHSLYRGVYAVGHPLIPLEGHWLAAVLACGERAVLSHRDAAALWGIRRSASPAIDVTAPGRSGRKRRRGFTLHRSPLPSEEVTIRHGVPVTTVSRTLLDLAAVLPAEALKKAIEEAERLRLFDLTEVEQTLGRNAGRAGRAALVKALSKYEEPPFTRSDLEDLLFAFCKRYRLPKPMVNAAVAGHEVDFLWQKARLIVETDGREDHLTRHAFEEDRARDAHLVLLGYRVVRFTYRQLRYERKYVETILERLLQPARSISSTL